MADTKNNIETKVSLNASQAQQEIVKLNSVAGDSTKTLEERIAAKNKQVEIQNKLSKETIEALENERRTLEGRGATEKELMAVFKKLNAAKLKAVKISESNTKAMNALQSASDDSKDSFKQLDGATGGLLTRFKALATNPIGIVLTALVGIFKALKGAVSRSGKASETFNKIGAKLSGIFNGLLAILEPVVEFIGDKLLQALNDPKQALIDLGDSIKKNIITRFEAIPKLGKAVVLFFKGEFKKAASVGGEAMLELGTGTEDVIEKINEFGEAAKKRFNEAAAATENLANAEKSLARNRIALEKEQLKSLRLAEEQRQIRDDESKSIEERIRANKDLGNILDKQAQRELSIARQNLNFARMQAKSTGDTIENIEAIGDAEIKLLEIRERITGQRSEQLVNENSLLKEQKALKEEEVAEELRKEKEAEEKRQEEIEAAQVKFEEDLERQIAFDEIELERLAEKGASTAEIEAEILKNRAEIEISQAMGNAEQIELIEAKKQLALDKIKQAEKKATLEKNAAELENTVNSAAEAFGITQEVAVAKMIMAAPEAVAGSFKEAAKSYAPPLSLVMGALGAAGTVAPIVKGLADIKKARFSKSKGSSSSGGSINVSRGGGSSSAASSITPEVVSNIASNNSARLGLDTEIGNGASATASNNIAGGASNNIVFSESKYSDFKNQVQFKEDKTTI